MGIEGLLPCEVKFTQNLKNPEGCDVLCIIDPNDCYLYDENLNATFNQFRSFDKAFDSEVSCFKVPNVDLPVIYSPIGNLTDYHDVRVYGKAAAKALSRAIKAGSKYPLLVIPSSTNLEHTELSTILGALEELYVPIQLREDVPEKNKRVVSLTFLSNNLKVSDIYKEALLIESGRFVARDIGVGDPERMTPPRVEEYIKSVFRNLKVTVVSDEATLKREYPLFAAVDRAARSVKRHQGRIIFLEWISPSAKKSILLVGKGVTYDTGGADIKAGGIMASMSRDKCGAAAVAGFMQIVQERKPTNCNVIAALCMVRNSVGEECYVSDEVITSRAGVRVRIGNTDAEGRMCMTDALCRMKELAVNLPDPHLFTIATLTGHAVIAVGEGYSIVCENSVARKSSHAENLKTTGDRYGDPFEISTLRQDDFDFNKGKVIGEDVVQCNNLASSRTPRGHQIPVSFMIVAAGLDKHGLNSERPLKYSHIDVAGSAGEYPEMPTGAPILALLKTHLA